MHTIDKCEPVLQDTDSMVPRANRGTVTMWRTCVPERKAKTCCKLSWVVWLAEGTDERMSRRKLLKTTTVSINSTEDRISVRVCTEILSSVELML